jgi:sugar lactone lactonase YvrE
MSMSTRELASQLGIDPTVIHKLKKQHSLAEGTHWNKVENTLFWTEAGIRQIQSLTGFDESTDSLDSLDEFVEDMANQITEDVAVAVVEMALPRIRQRVFSLLAQRFRLSDQPIDIEGIISQQLESSTQLALGNSEMEASA